MGKRIDLTKMSAHIIIDRAYRIKQIENSIGWGTEIARALDKNEENVFRVLTTTGVIIVMDETNFIITAWVADVNQAVAVWKKANNGKQMPKWLWNMVNYNNDTTYWRNLVAA